MATNFGTKSAYIRDIHEILRITGGFRCRVIEWSQTNSTKTNSRWHGNEIWAKIGYNSACIRDVSEIFASNGGFRVRLSNDVNQILQRPTVVVMATKFETKSAITRSVCIL